MDSGITPMTLGEIFDRTLSLIGKTFVRSVTLSVGFLIIPIVLVTLSAHRFYVIMPAFTTGSGPKDFSNFAPMVSAGFYFGIAYLLFAAAAIMAEISISIIIAAEMRSERVSAKEAARMTFSGRWLNGIGEGFLKTLLFVGLGVFAAIVAGIMAAIIKTSRGSSNAFLILFAILLIFVIVAIIFYLIVRLYFALTAVAVQDLGPVAALKKSWSLVREHWWRTLGLLILFFILSGFAVSIITVPVTFGTMWNSYKEFFTFMGQTGGKINPAQLHNFQTGFGTTIGISSGLSSILSLLITPAFTVVMYFDLRARHNDLPAEKSPAAGDSLPPITAI